MNLGASSHSKVIPREAAAKTARRIHTKKEFKFITNNLNISITDLLDLALSDVESLLASAARRPTGVGAVPRR